MRILDIDLDFFLNHRHNAAGNERLDSSYYFPWPEKKVTDYLEKHLGLSPAMTISGKFFEHHDAVFIFCKNLINKKLLTIPFEIVHVDAHSDLGIDYIKPSLTNILEDLLKESLDNRVLEAEKFIDSGNFLAYMLACRWINKLTFITPPAWRDDLQHRFFKNQDEGTGIIQFRHFPPGSFMKRGSYKGVTPIHLEPEIIFERIESENYFNEEPFSYIFLTHSPDYTPVTSDQLIPLIMKHIDNDFNIDGGD